jgi:putative endonuclease
MNYDTNCVYILTNKINTVLYTGVTSNLVKRLSEHRTAGNKDFVFRYKAFKLVYFECGGDIMSAISREKQIKGGSRAKKIALINSINPEWRDLSEDFFS